MQLADVITTRIRLRLGELRKAATLRRRMVRGDQGAEIIDYCAAEIEEELELLEASDAWVTPEQFAQMQPRATSVQAVRRWIRQGRLAADRTPKGYLIRRTARVRARQAS